jgi:Tol biopolymer transport system component
MTFRHVLALTPAALAIFAAGCGSDSSGPSDPLSKVPDFIYVSDASGAPQLYTWSHGTSTLFPGSIAGDNQPQTAAGKVVFTSYRISVANPEIFIANLDGSNTLRLTTDVHTDIDPSLSPDGGTVVFTSTRSGTSRVWIMNADGSNQAALNTGSAADIPESSARYSPGGGRILFNSPRTNTTQIWIVPSAGGTATQVTHEVNGAFFGSWSPDGNSIYYVDGSDRTKVHKVDIASGDVTDYVTGGTDVGEESCTNDACLVVTNATSLDQDIVAYVGAGSAPTPILTDAPNEYQPAAIHR